MQPSKVPLTDEQFSKIQQAPRPDAINLALTEDQVIINGSEQCDMALGPCACGATHRESELHRRGLI